ncbi:DUF3870 domain-containing protein [Clostridium luticellarii]|uniref:DUF3870 domain-containing protein n=1 Tax=Clostridium luticellarii TaxID=1691940 RepID=A0A2T0BK12_9CLOT|nr:DUF3870 domain-containing protein [Clostridium luticellarii]MCI1944932.1 DUF3870 domain-containing protein [Clostridium luticellarii]MCI1968392.1 DUF3870 domain-containing protein [Clostridium luticellarii]MCI1995390.1 DUF3870 domain-containing protein [Clostridium luticellarii]MCI2039453.1 DUF3870 domain-containing protein [Clostridium luticellarii]PRR84236.1 hypothetical protein CLLU_24430 [Clostridium luticellarii]
MRKNKIFISAYSKLPQGISAAEIYVEAAMSLVVDRNTGTIYDMECTLATDIAKEYIKDIVVGRNINQIDDIIQDIKDNYLGTAQRAVIAVLTNCYKRYMLVHVNFDENK